MSWIFSVLLLILSPCLANEEPRWAQGPQRDGYWSFSDLQQASWLMSSFRVEQGVVATTLQGREIPYFRLGIESAETRPAILLVALTHATEVLGLQTLLATVDLLQNEHSEVFELIDVYVVPMANPDGYEHNVKEKAKDGEDYWLRRSNLRKTCEENDEKRDDDVHMVGGGVDLNRNFNFSWEASLVANVSRHEQELLVDHCSVNYQGASPLSEPETQGLADFLAQRPQIKALLEFHGLPAETDSLLIRPFAYSMKDVLAEDQATLDKIDSLAQAMDPEGRLLKYGTAYRTIGYIATGTLLDYAFAKHGILSFVMEIAHSSFWPEHEDMMKAVDSHSKVSVLFATRAAEMFGIRAQWIPLRSILIVCVSIVVIVVFFLVYALKKSPPAQHSTEGDEEYERLPLSELTRKSFLSVNLDSEPEN